MKPRAQGFVAVALAGLVAACAPGPDIDPARHQSYLVYDWSRESQRYELHPSNITTLEDPRAISGTIAELRGGGSVIVTLQMPRTKQEFADAIEIRGARTPSAEYYFDGDVVVPYDFDTQMMVTLYHHLERADEYFVGLGVEPIGRLQTYYFPTLTLLGIPLPLLTDNAAYAMTLDAFLIPPTALLTEGVPLSANRGVIVHEYSHAVFNRAVFGDDRAPDPLWDPSFPDDAYMEIRSLDEGLADLFGALAVTDPDFIIPSISEEVFEVDRDLTTERIWNAELQRKIDDVDPATGPNPYLLGSVIAGALWSTRTFLGDEEIALNTLAAERAIAFPGREFGLSDFLNAWLAELDPEDVEAVCAIFTVRFERGRAELDCP